MNRGTTRRHGVVLDRARGIVHHRRKCPGAGRAGSGAEVYECHAGLLGRCDGAGVLRRAVAIAIHNIPEGVAVSAPVYAATGSRGKAFLWSFLSGVAEPVGAGLAALVLLPFMTEAVLGWTLSGVAGIMVFISLDELVPVSHSFGKGHLAIVGVVAGMVIMAFSLWMLR